MRKLLSVLFSTLQGGVRGGLLFMALLATTTVFGLDYGPISVTDGTAADWDAFPAEYVASATHSDGCSLDGLKSVKVYCDDYYLNILVEVNLDVVTDHAWTPFHIFLNADGSAATGGYGDLFADADTELMLETAIYADGAVQYNPAVFKWWGEVGGSGWLWTDPNGVFDDTNGWGAIVPEGSLPIGNAQAVGGIGLIEIQLLKELIPAQWADEFTIGFEIQQWWTFCGILPNAPDDAETGQVVRAEKLKVHVHHTDYGSSLHQDGLYYEITSNVEPYTVAVVDADADITMATIPETIEFYGKTYAVTSIGDEAFSYCSSLTSVTIPNSVTTIGSSAFLYCSSLTSMTIPNSVTSIGDWAFGECSYLTSVTIPNSVTSIGDWAFSDCSSLTSMTIPNSVISIGDYAFYDCSSLTSVTIGESVTSIGDWAFYDCSSLTSVTIPNSVTSIRNSAFAGCFSLTSVTIGESVTSIGFHAFRGCSSLTSITIPNSVWNIEERAFSNCSVLESIVWNAKYCADASSLETAPFYGITSQIKSFTFGETVEHIPAYLCYGMDKLTSVTIPNNVTSIGDEAFSNCSVLESIVWNAKNQANPANKEAAPFFDICSQIKSFTFGETVEYIPAYLCYGIDKLTSVTIPNNVTSIGDEAFSNCSVLESIVWNAKNCADTSSLETAPFYGITSQIKSFTFGETVEYIPAYLCYGMEKLTSVTTPNSLKTIGTSAFEGCVRLGKISLGTGLEEIAANAFAGCTRLYDIYVYATYPPFAEESSFANYNVYVYIPCEYQRDYTLDVVWGNFKFIECIESEDVTTDGVIITPSTNDVTITWPTEDNAENYTIVIEKDGEVFCTLTFNADGQLLNIAFAPSRDGNNRPVQYAEQAVNGYRFTVTGLEEGTHYAYNIDVKDAADKTIKSYTGEFTTESTTAVENTHSQSPIINCQKIIRDGQLYIYHNDKTYNTVGQIVE